MADDAQLVMPKLGLTMTEGTVTEWRVQPGAAFKAGDILVVVETEKIANEVEAVADGVMSTHLVNTGDTVPVGTPIARWQGGVGGAATATPAPAAPPKVAPPAAAALPAAKSPPKPVATPMPVPAGGRIIATPLAKRIAKEKGVDLRALTGSGPNGRIKAIDVENAPRGGIAATAVTPTATTAPASFFLMATARVTDLAALKKQIAVLGGMDQVSIAHFAVLAAAPALAQSPAASSNIAVSVGGVTPALLRDASDLRLSAIISGLAEGAEGPAAMTIMDVGTEEISYLSVPLPRGQAATLGIGAVQAVFKPDAQGKPVLVEEVGLVLTCDSAIFDVAAGMNLLGAIKTTLENPLRILAA